MTKQELIDRIAMSADLSTKASAARALDAALDAIKGALKKGQKVTLVEPTLNLQSALSSMTRP